MKYDVVVIGGGAAGSVVASFMMNMGNHPFELALDNSNSRGISPFSLFFSQFLHSVKQSHREATRRQE